MKPKYFVQFYRWDGNNYVEVLGSDGVAYLDGRSSSVSMAREAATIGHKRKFDGYRVAFGTHTNPGWRNVSVQPILPYNVNA